jgi:hypothetical protein
VNLDVSLVELLWASILLGAAGVIFALALPSRLHPWLWALSFLYPTTLLVWFVFDPLVDEGEFSYAETAETVGILFGIWVAIAAALYGVRRVVEELLRESRCY